jgi:hypothetical protein
MVFPVFLGKVVEMHFRAGFALNLTPGVDA